MVVSLNVVRQPFYHSETALARSRYLRPLQPPGPHHVSHLPQRLFVLPEGKIWPDQHDKHATPLEQLLFDEFRGKTGSSAFPCIGAETINAHNWMTVGIYPKLADPESVAGHGHDMLRWISERERVGERTSFFAIFENPAPSSEEEFEDLMWKHMQMLHDHDTAEWDPEYSPDPANPHFAFSFGGLGCFVIGFNPHASRISRQFSRCAIVFNPEIQIKALKEKNQFVHWLQIIRDRDKSLQGSINPMVPQGDLAAKESEAHVYSGRAVGPDWVCKFKPREGLVDPKAGAVVPDGHNVHHLGGQQAGSRCPFQQMMGIFGK